jgi:D-amino-acid dehydrogenase
MPIIDDGRLFGLVPLGDRMRVSGSAEVAGFDTTPSPVRCQAIVDNVVSVFPGFARCVDPATAKYWAGVRPVTPTGTPILDRAPLANLYIAAGHGHLGWTMGCGSGQVMADLVAGRPPEIEMSGFALADH